MSTAYPALGFDPAPGDPVAVGALSREAGRVTREVSALGDQLRRLGEVHAVWQGTAAQEFVRLVKQLPNSLRDTEAAFDILARRLSGWELTLLDLQASARALEAEAQASRARRGAVWQSASTPEAVPVPPVRFGPATGQALIGTPTAPGAAQEARVRARAALVLDCEQEIAAIVGRARELQRRAKHEGDQVAVAVRTATGFAPPPPGVFERLGDWFGEVDRAVGNFVNNHIDDITHLAEAAAALGLIAMCIPGVGVVPGLLFGGLALVATGALARYADGSKTDVAWAATGVGVGAVASRAGRFAATARADETGTAVMPLASMWTATGGGPREEKWRAVQISVNVFLALPLAVYGAAVPITRRQGRQAPPPDDPKPRLQLALPTAPALQVPSRGVPTSGAIVAPVVGAPEPGRRPEPRRLWPQTHDGAPLAHDGAPLAHDGAPDPGSAPSGSGPASRPTTIGAP